jgi:hypothetical protein
MPRTRINGEIREAPPSARPRKTEPPAAWRALAVSLGPSLVLHGLIGASVLLGAFSLARSRRPAFGEPPWRPWLHRAAVTGSVLSWTWLFALRPWHRSWGATPEEVRAPLPGDEIVPHPAVETTRAVTIHAPAGRVWPWLVQMGQDKGGLYSYDWLENLAGLDFRSARRIEPRWQRISEGDYVRLAPGMDTLRVVRLQPERTLVLRLVDPASGKTLDERSPRPARWWDATWTFALTPVDARTCRLVVRWRTDGEPRKLLPLLYGVAVEVPHFIMERKTLLGIRARAEA